MNISNEPQKPKIKLFEIERARLVFQSVELDEFQDAEKWIELAVMQFKKAHFLRPQLCEEIENVAFEHVQGRWENYAKPITAGLILVMVKTYLEKYIAKDKSLFSNPHPERHTAEEELNSLFLKVQTWQERETWKDTLLDIRKVKNLLSKEGRLILDALLAEDTISEIITTLKGKKHNSGLKFLYKQIASIKKHFVKLGYGV